MTTDLTVREEHDKGQGSRHDTMRDGWVVWFGHRICKTFSSLKRLVVKERYHDDRDSLLCTDAVDDHPQGYPRLAGYVNSDADFAMFRKFGALQCRVLLHQQAELSKLEKKLSELDHRDDVENNTRIQSIQCDQEKDSKRTALIDEINAKLKDYRENLLQAQKIRSIGPPTKRNHRSLYNWIYNERPLVPSEMDFIFHKDDFMSIAGDQEQNSLLETGTEVVITRFTPRSFQTLFASPEQLANTKNAHIHYFSKQRIAGLAVFMSLLFVSITIGLNFWPNTRAPVMLITTALCLGFLTLGIKDDKNWIFVFLGGLALCSLLLRGYDGNT